MTEYIYDGDGNRVAKGPITAFSCDRTANGFTFSNAYIVGQSGEQLDETDGNGYELHSNTFAGGRLLFTYDENASEWGVALSDWLGTKRVQVDPAVLANVTSFLSLPFGDGLVSSGYGEDSTGVGFGGADGERVFGGVGVGEGSGSLLR